MICARCKNEAGDDYYGSVWGPVSCFACWVRDQELTPEQARRLASALLAWAAEPAEPEPADVEKAVRSVRAAMGVGAGAETQIGLGRPKKT